MKNFRWVLVIFPKKTSYQITHNRYTHKSKPIVSLIPLRNSNFVHTKINFPFVTNSSPTSKKVSFYIIPENWKKKWNKKQLPVVAGKSGLEFEHVIPSVGGWCLKARSLLESNFEFKCDHKGMVNDRAPQAILSWTGFQKLCVCVHRSERIKKLTVKYYLEVGDFCMPSI